MKTHYSERYLNLALQGHFILLSLCKDTRCWVWEEFNYSVNQTWLWTNYERVRKRFPSAAFAHIPYCERCGWFICIHLQFALGFYMAYAVYIHCLNNLCKIDVFIYLIDILLEQAWKTACSVQFSLAQALQRCSKVNYQNPGICVSPPPPPPPSCCCSTS